MKSELTALSLLVACALMIAGALFISFVYADHITQMARLDTETTIASLKNRWRLLNDELQSLRKENEKLRKDVRRIKAGKDDDYERREAE